jgi:hypothetical protein
MIRRFHDSKRAMNFILANFPSQPKSLFQFAGPHFGILFSFLVDIKSLLPIVEQLFQRPLILILIPSPFVYPELQFSLEPQA